MCAAVHKPDLTAEELRQLGDWYQNDFGLPPEAHPCDLKSSVNPSGRVQSSYVPPPVLIA